MIRRFLAVQAIILIHVSASETPTDDAYIYLHHEMNKFHSFSDGQRMRAIFDVYTEKDAPGNHFSSTGAMGDWDDLIFDPRNTTLPFSGRECLKIVYTARSSQGNGWSATYWQYPPTNWGNIPGAYDLRGAVELRGRVRGQRGGERVEFKVGGINRPPYHDAAIPFQDSCDLLTTGPITLSQDWQEFRIDLVNPEHFWIYRDWYAPENHFAPSGWMGDYGSLQVDEHWTNSPYSSPSCIRIHYSGVATEGQKWAGIYWQTPPNNWGDMAGGFDWSGAKKLSFRIRADVPPGGRTGPMRFFAGGISGPSNRDSFRTPYYQLTPTESWAEVTIDLSDFDLSNVIGGFGWVTSQGENPAGCTIYLDDIRLDKELTKDLSHMIGGILPCS